MCEGCGGGMDGGSERKGEGEDIAIEELVRGLRERERRAVYRRVANGETAIDVVADLIGMDLNCGEDEVENGREVAKEEMTQK